MTEQIVWLLRGVVIVIGVLGCMIMVLIGMLADKLDEIYILLK